VISPRNKVTFFPANIYFFISLLHSQTAENRNVRITFSLSSRCML